MFTSEVSAEGEGIMISDEPMVFGGVAGRPDVRDQLARAKGVCSSVVVADVSQELIVMTMLCGAPGRRGRMVDIRCRPQIATTEGATVALGRWRRGGAIWTLSFGIDHERGFMDGGDGRRGRGSYL